MFSYIILILHGFRNLTKQMNSFSGYLRQPPQIAKTILRDYNKLNEMHSVLAI